MNTTNGAAADLAELVRRQHAVDRLLMAEGAGHIVHDLPTRADGRHVGVASRPWRLDPTPYVLGAADFAWIEEAITRRMRMLEALLVDLYSDRSLVADGVIDPALLWSSDGYRLAAVGASQRRGQRRWLSRYSVDLVRRQDGAWFAVADLTDAPVGLGYALLDRSVITQVADPGPEPPRSIEYSLETVRRALVDATTVEGPRVVVLTSGIDHPAYVEHSYMATQLGFNIVEGPDLVVRDHELWLRTLGGLERIDVLYRRISDRQLDPLETNTYGAAGIPAVLLADEKSQLAIANAHGTGVLEAPTLVGLWDRAGGLLTGEAPWLTLASARSMPGATGVDDLIGGPAERVSCLIDDRLVERPIVLRFHAVATNEGIHVFPVANGRIIEPHDDPTTPTPCLATDVWVLGEPAKPLPTTPARSAPQVDFITSVPTRAADSLYWLGRASERAEVVARAARVIATAPPGLGWSGRPTPAMRLLSALSGFGDADTMAEIAAAPSLAEARLVAVRAASASLEFHVGSMLAESASVREFLSSTTGRVLGEMVDTREHLVAHPGDVDALDTILFQLSAFGGLWSESVVRGPAWYFGDFAKRYERTVVALTSAASAIRFSTDEHDPADPSRGLEAVLAANDSLVAYRRRHRSDVEIGAVLALLLHDQRNPRSAAASIGGLLRNADAIGWTAGLPMIEAVGATIERAQVHASVGALDQAIEALHALAAELTSTRLVAPPHPTLVRPRLVDPGAVA